MIQSYSLNLRPNYGSVIVPCSQYDTTLREIQFTIYNGSAIYSIPDNSVVTLRGTKPQDNTGFEYECSYSGSVVTFALQPQVTVYDGKIPAELRITKDGAIIGTANFVFNVEKSALDSNVVISDTDLPLLQEAINSVDEVLSYRNEAEQSAEDSQGYSEDSEAWAVGERGGVEVESTDETYHNNSKYYSELADTYSQNASSYATNASNSATEASGYADDAQSSATQAQGYAEASSDSADEASVSAFNASNSEHNASVSATSASDSATSAQTYANNASNSALSASQSATQAQGYASNASASATNAQTYANNAYNSATTASQKANEASASATNASNSATQASQSASTASSKASEASQSATNASASATSASTYATNSSNSATASSNSALKSEGFAIGQQNGTDVTSGSPYYENNAKYYSEEAETSYNNTVALSNNFAQKDGVYPKLIAGGIVESETKDDEFTYQVTEHTGIANLNSIKGNTLVWNQLDHLSSGTITQDGVTLTRDLTTQTITLNGTATADSTFNNVGLVGTSGYVTGHKYLIIGSKANAEIRYPYSSVRDTGNGAIVTFSSTATAFRVIVTNGTTFSNLELRPQCFDLTAMFGANNEPSTVDEFKALFPLDYYAYDAGSLLNFNGTGIKTVGFNQWDEEWKQGDITTSNGSETEGTKVISKNFCPMFPNTTYYIISTSEGNMGIFFYDEDFNYIDMVWKANNTFVSPSNARYFKLRCPTQYGTTYKDDICINISSSRNGEYEPYKESTLSLPISTYFPTGMKSAGSAYDELTPSKAITRIGTRAYQSGDESDTTVTTDGTNTNYALATPTETDVDLNLTYRTYEGGTEQLLPVNTDVPTTSPIKVNVEFDFDENLNALLVKMLNCIATVETSPSANNYSVGDYLMYEYQLYKVTSAITTGQSLTVGTNITATTVMSELKSLTA